MSAWTFARAILDRYAAPVHCSWMTGQRHSGKSFVRSRLTGLDLMVPYLDLHDEDQQVDRDTVEAVLTQLVNDGHLAACPLDADNPPPARVRYVIDGEGDLWERMESGDFWVPRDGMSYSKSWPQLYGVHAPITVLVAAIPLAARA